MSLEYLLNDENDDEILAQVQEESLRYYREFELPRLQNDSLAVAGNSKETCRDATESDRTDLSEAGKSSENHVDSKCDSILCTQVGGKAGALLYEGEEAKGFHLAAGASYVYPTNFPIRQYQAAIVRSALFKNTLVSLPTGLGKTFIAAVVMYNFYRWFPRGKVVFMAPTRPLVAQQIKACYSVMGIPPDDTTEMTGIQAAEVRETLWKEKRVFFLTPQVMANDLRSSICPADLVKCLVVDEAHKAVKDYAYCQVVKSLSASNSVYRTLALSATPGNDINAVIQVIRNLNICCLEMRGEDSIDVAPYTHGKSVEQVVVDLSPELIRVKDDFMQVYERFARSLIENRALTSNIAYLSKFQILKAMEKFRANPPRGMSPTLIGSLVSDFTMCMTFAHALELMQIYGLRAFYRYLADESGEKSKAATTRLKNNDDLQRMLKKLHSILYPKPGSDVPYTWGHPKLKKLVTSLSDHFKAAEGKAEKTKAIVFCNYKIVVNEIVDLLVQCKPHIQAALFVGQSGGKEKGMPQAKQLQIMKDFRDGKINCLVATCVAEEGLDIGEVDLIVLMESQKSPVRLVQRLGRTGRKRRGRCIVLLTRGKEESKFHEAMASRKSYVKNIVDSKAVKNSLCQYSPPMFPPDVNPQQQLVHIKVITTPTPTKPVKPNKKQMDIRECAVPEERPFLEDEAAMKIIDELEGNSLNFNRLPSKMELWHRRSGPMMNFDELFNTACTSNLASWNDWNTELHKSFMISSTSSSGLYCHLMSYAPEEENVEYLKLVQDYETGGVLASRKASPSKNVEKVPEEVEDKKPAKKKICVKKNYGMDIRSCMAVAVERANKKPKLDLSDDDVIIIDNDDFGIVGDCQANVEDVAFESRCSPVSHTFQKPPADETPAVVGDRIENQLNIAALFGMNEDDFENVLLGGELLCGLERDIDMCFRLGKFLGDPKHEAPKPKCMDVDVFRFQCDQLLGLMDGIRDIPLGTKAVLQVETDSKYEALKSPISRTTNSPGIHSNRDSEPGIEHNDLNESFVGIDDLFGDDEFFQDLERNVPDVGERTSIEKPDLDKDEPQMDGFPVSSPLSNKISELANIGEISPIAVKKNDTYSCYWGSNSVFAGPITPLSKAASNSSKQIVSSTPINQNRKNSDLFGVLEEQPVHEKEEWLLDDILEEEEISKDDVKTKAISVNDPPFNSSRDLFSSPPGGKVFQKSKVACGWSPEEPFKKPVPKALARDNFEEDFWCMDDLFDDDKSELSNRDTKDETALYGITQMVSQIERDKIKNREIACQGEVIEILDSPCSSPVQNVGERFLLSPAGPVDRQTSQELGDSRKHSSFSSYVEKQTIENLKHENLLNKMAPSSTQKPSQSEKGPFRLTSTVEQPNAVEVIEKPVFSTLDFDFPDNDKSKSKDVQLSCVAIPIKPSQEDLPIYVIDSDSNGSLNSGPLPITSKGLQNSPLKDKSVNAKDSSCHSLLDEDDDIFNLLPCDGNLVGEKINELSTKPDTSTKSILNMKKFKQKSSNLFSRLDSEPDNDFPPEKRDVDPDGAVHLKVGSLSRRKLSFEDVLNELDDSGTSKYFASSKTTLRQSSTREPCVESNVKSKHTIRRIPMDVSLDEEDDIFVRPGQKQLVEEPSRNESSTTSSHSSSPVKKVKKKKGHAFIEREAEESGTMSSDDSDNSSLDQMDDSFVDDNSDQELSYAHYLKSVKSPVGGGKFKIPVTKRYLGNVYSQLVNDAEEDYENDSFCVDSNEEQSGDETTILEQAERKLPKKKLRKKRKLGLESSDTDIEHQPMDLESSAVMPRFPNKYKRRLLESDSDHTPERVPLKRPRNRIVSPVEDVTTTKILEPVRNPSREGETGALAKQKAPPSGIVKHTSQNNDPPRIRLEFDSDEELQEAIRRSVQETKAKSPEELKFEEDLQKALLLSQHDVRGSSIVIRSTTTRNLDPSDSRENPGPSGLCRNSDSKITGSNFARRNLSSGTGSQNVPPSFIHEDEGTSFLFMSQPILKDRKPLSTKPKVSKPSGPSRKKCKKVFELSDDSN